MGNEIGKFSLEHVSNVYIQDANGQIAIILIGKGHQMLRV